MKYSLYATISLVILLFVLNLLNYDAFYFIGGSIEWATRYVLPWIALYWFVKFVKTKKE
ncbi:hypothetical protein AWH56_011515 [Anaerobacillus isosaccharinicus]|uniref:Uncharacterized protein n=1 Tax=Anaerobacillus isosaccharinicus TaxID=1532552 RepID=A0A7S7RDI3_9BACI|nr:hypothetical protein [Anaerobacillus isosaccharinicus]MBA5588471.1 hypothetical protein [Anaerobacillus isosaccharinicus]QOY38104.1 hypothetical protein AWH56_011515 [Anaerobacillus isosaccharinicus]